MKKNILLGCLIVAYSSMNGMEQREVAKTISGVLVALNYARHEKAIDDYLATHKTVSPLECRFRGGKFPDDRRRAIVHRGILSGDLVMNSDGHLVKGKRKSFLDMLIYSDGHLFSSQSSRIFRDHK